MFANNYYPVIRDMMSVALMKDEIDPSKHKGFGFISYVDHDNAEMAVEIMNGKEHEREDGSKQVNFIQMILLSEFFIRFYMLVEHRKKPNAKMN